MPFSGRGSARSGSWVGGYQRKPNAWTTLYLNLFANRPDPPIVHGTDADVLTRDEHVGLALLVSVTYV